MAEIKQTERAAKLLVAAMECSRERRHEFIMPEHLLLRLTDDFNFHAALNIFYPPQKLVERLEEQLARVERVPDGIDYQPAPSEQMGRLIEMACRQVVSSSAPAIDLPHLVQAMLQLEDSWACYLLKDCLLDKESNFMSHLIEFCEFDDSLHDQFGPSQQEDAWRQLVSCMNDLYKQHNPLIGREQELQPRVDEIEVERMVAQARRGRLVLALHEMERERAVAPALLEDAVDAVEEEEDARLLVECELHRARAERLGRDDVGAAELEDEHGAAAVDLEHAAVCLVDDGQGERLADGEGLIVGHGEDSFARCLRTAPCGARTSVVSLPA